MDDDNIIGGLKAARDALFKGRVTPDDSSQYVEIGTITQETGLAYRHKAHVVFIIE